MEAFIDFKNVSIPIFHDLKIKVYYIHLNEENNYLITYNLIDSAGDLYIQREEIAIDDKGIIIDAYLYFEEWERVYFYALSTDELYDYLINALQEKNYPKLLSVLHDEVYVENEDRNIASISNISVNIIEKNENYILVEINCFDSDSVLLPSGKYNFQLNAFSDKLGYFLTTVDIE